MLRSTRPRSKSSSRDGEEELGLDHYQLMNALAIVRFWTNSNPKSNPTPYVTASPLEAAQLLIPI